MTIASPRASGAVVVDAESPWPGLEAFHEQDHRFFHGREQEVDEVRRRALSERLTVLFGLSGLGKTSLLQAGLFPRLRQERVLPVYIRLDYSEGSPDLRSQVKSKITEAAIAAAVEAPAIRASDTLWELFHREERDFWDRANRLVTPLLAFDQFEEIFTLGTGGPERSARTAAFLDELGNLIEGHPPAAVRTRLDREPDEVKDFVFDRHCYKVIVSLREDFLADFEGLRERMPSVVHNRVRLRRMNGQQALRVVTEAGGHLVEEGVAPQIVRFVAGRRDAEGVPLGGLEVEPALLSLCCSELNMKRIQQKRTEPRSPSTITADLLKESATEILQDFYERSVADVLPEVRTFIEDRLITASGYRDTIALDNLPTGVARETVNRLVDRRLLRLEERAGVQRIELTHDVLTGVIRASRDSRRQRETRARARRVRWVAAGLALVSLGGMGIWYVTSLSSAYIRAIEDAREDVPYRAYEKLRGSPGYEARAEELFSAYWERRGLGGFGVRMTNLAVPGHRAPLRIIEVPFPPGEYYHDSVPKRRIVLTATMAGSAVSTIRWLRDDNRRVGTPYVIDRDGTVFQVFEPQYWAHLLGGVLPARIRLQFDKESIGIYLANAGPLIKRDSSFYQFDRVSEVTRYTSNPYDFGRDYRGYRYYERYTEEQYASLILLLKRLVNEFRIPASFLPDSLRIETRPEALDFNGVLSLANVRTDKIGVGPAFDWQRVINELRE